MFKNIKIGLLLIIILIGIVSCNNPKIQQKPSFFKYRGYYFILSRNPNYGLKEYKYILDCMAEDNCNMLILWIGGGFPSKRYPETWDYNKNHRNCTENFTKDLIDYAHNKGIKILLGLSPYVYDGVNRYGLAHPELSAVDTTGKILYGGINSFGNSLCPSKPGAREFMYNYCTELFDEFYPNADGFFLEHSDYGFCQCPDCRSSKGYYEKEWTFIDRISKHVWEKNPDATMMIFPQYETKLGITIDPRYLYFIAPHNTCEIKPGHEKILWHGYWDDHMNFKDLCCKAKETGCQGIIPSMENFMYANPYAFDARWEPKGVFGWNDLLVKYTRLTFLKYAEKPDMTDGEFVKSVKEKFFSPDTPDKAVNDLKRMHTIINENWNAWWNRTGLLSVPDSPVEYNTLKQDYQKNLLELKDICTRSAQAEKNSISPAKETFNKMGTICNSIYYAWLGKDCCEGLILNR